jgi:hypothetical protein
MSQGSPDEMTERVVKRFAAHSLPRSEMKVHMLNTDVVFPVSVTFEDGSLEQYESIEDLAANLEDFDSDIDVGCRVEDNLGRLVHLKLKLLEVRKLFVISQS